MAINKFNLFGVKNNIYYSADINNGGYQFSNDSTDIDYDKIISVCTDEWQKANTTLTENVDGYSKKFEKLDFLAGSYTKMLENSMLEILEISKKIKDSVKTFAEKQKELDNGNAWGDGTGGNGDQNGDKNQQVPIVPPIVEDPDAPDPNGSEDDDDDDQSENPIVPPDLNNPNANSSFDKDKIKITDIDGLMETLRSIASEYNMTLDELLSDASLFEEIKKALLKSPYLSEDLKKYLEDLQAKIIAEFLLGVLSGEVPELFNMNPTNWGVVYSYFEGIAFANSITVMELLKDPRNKQLLKEAIDDFSATYDYLKDALNCSAVEFQGLLLKIMDGDGIASIDEGVVKLIREYLNYIASESGISVEELLTNPIYADILKKGFEEFKNLSLFMKNLSYLDFTKVQEIINAIFDGKNAKAFGLTDSDLLKFRDKMQAIAEDIGISLDYLLSDPKYAATVKDALNNIFKEIGYIFRNLDPSAVQDFVKNILAQVAGGNYDPTVVGGGQGMFFIPPIIGGVAAVIDGDKDKGKEDEEEKPTDSEEIKNPNANQSFDKDKIKITDISGLIEALRSIANKNNVTLDELLSDASLFAEIKEELLKLPYLSEETKKYLEGLDDKSVVDALFSILSGKVPELFSMNPTNLGVVYSYFESIAFENSITVMELLNDPKNKQLLKKILEDFSVTYDYLTEALNSSADEFQALLLKIIDGDGIGSIDEGVVKLIREYVNYLSSKFGISVEELLTNPAYANMLKNYFEEFKNLSLFMKTMSYFSDDKAWEIINAIFDGKNAEAFGLTNDDLLTFRDKMQAIAEDDGISLDELLSNSKYADQVKDELNKNAQDVGYIYRNQDSTVAQNVAKNLCEQAGVDKNNSNNTKQYENITPTPVIAEENDNSAVWQNEMLIVPPIVGGLGAVIKNDKKQEDEYSQLENTIETPTQEDSDSNWSTAKGKMKISDIAGLIEELKSIADENDMMLDELLLDDNFFDEIKKQVLNSSHLKEKEKKYFEGLDAKSVAEVLFSIISGEIPELFNMNPLNLGAVYSYLEDVAFENSITVLELLKDPSNSELLKRILEDFSATYDYLTEALNCSADEFQALLLKIMDGDEIGSIDEGVINLIREYINYLSSKFGISVKELLTNPTYANMLKNHFEEFKNLVLFMKIMSYFSDTKSQEIIDSIFDGKNAKAFGLYGKNLSLFKSEIENIAKSKDISLDELLSDPEYADFVKDALKDSKTVQDVGYIYRNQDSTVIQNVVKNIYEQPNSNDSDN